MKDGGVKVTEFITGISEYQDLVSCRIEIRREERRKNGMEARKVKKNDEHGIQNGKIWGKVSRCKYLILPWTWTVVYTKIGRNRSTRQEI